MNRVDENLKLLFFSSKTDVHFERVSASIPGIVPQNRVFHYRDIGAFSDGLRDLLLGYCIMLIIIRDEVELDLLLQLASKLRDHSLILILDSDMDNLSARTLTLYPRYTTYLKADYNDVFLVVEKMAAKIQKKIEGEKKF